MAPEIEKSIRSLSLIRIWLGRKNGVALIRLTVFLMSPERRVSAVIDYSKAKELYCETEADMRGGFLEEKRLAGLEQPGGK